MNIHVELCRDLAKVIAGTTRNKHKEISEYVYDKYGIPKETTMDICRVKTPVESVDNFTLYALASAFNLNVKNYFTSKEINSLSKSKYKPVKISFPLKFKMIQIAEDQWIGKITVNEIIKLADAQLINYNMDAQRAPKAINIGDNTVYQIAVNKKAVEGIKESYNNGTYIPNTITLNIPEDSEFDYDGEELIIKSFKSFDILDGYHRYLAMNNMKLNNSDFDYDMELRIVCFGKEKAKQFIWQEDQKTKMKKVDSEAYNQNGYANQLVNMLNNETLLRGSISNMGIISPGKMIRALNATIFKRNKKYSRKELVEIKVCLLDKFSKLLDSDPDLLDKKWSTKYIATVMVIFNDKDAENDIPGNVNKLYSLIKDDKEFFSKDHLFNVDMKRLLKIYGKGGEE